MRKDELVKVEWWGCRECPKTIRREHWGAHKTAHNLLNGGLALQRIAQRAVPDYESPLLCGLCGDKFDGGPDELMEHLETEHFTVISKSKEEVHADRI